MGAAGILEGYGLRAVARVHITDGRFVIEMTDHEIGAVEKCIYAFVVGDEIIRIGSSKAPLRIRMGSWQRDVTKALGGLRSSTPAWEAAAWDDLFATHRSGLIYARQGTSVTTAAGTFCAYLDEESLLIGRHLPRLNRSKHR